MFDRLLAAAAKFFRMDEAVWERHANPWSVWTRFATTPFVLLALWSPHWIGWWAALPLALLLGWLWFNPRAFPPPASTASWAARAVLGERVYLARAVRPIPPRHAQATNRLAAISAAGAVVMIASLVAGWPVGYVAGGTLSVTAKLCFCDRMVRLFDDMSRTVPEYAAWLRANPYRFIRFTAGVSARTAARDCGQPHSRHTIPKSRRDAGRAGNRSRRRKAPAVKALLKFR